MRREVSLIACIPNPDNPNERVFRVFGWDLDDPSLVNLSLPKDLADLLKELREMGFSVVLDETDEDDEPNFFSLRVWADKDLKSYSVCVCRVLSANGFGEDKVVKVIREALRHILENVKKYLEGLLKGE